MSAITFDTLKYVERLTAAGLPVKQAKAEAEALRDALGDLVEMKSLATKEDISTTKLELKNSIESLRSEMHAMKADIIKWNIGTILAAAALAVAIARLIP